MFKQRLSPPDFKHYTEHLPIKRMPPPAEVILPLLQHTGLKLQPCIGAGDEVKLGQLIADTTGSLAAPVHASVSGKVKSIQVWPHPILGQCEAIVIASDNQDTPDNSIRDRDDAGFLSPVEIRKLIRSCGVVGLGGAGFPTHIKLAPPADKPVDTFILNGAECEPYLTADHRLMLEKSEQMLSGVRIIMLALGINSAVVAVEKNKPDVINLYRKLVDGRKIKLAVLPSIYPQGAEKQLIKAILRREVAPGELPFDVGVVVNNVATCFAIYEAVYKSKPLYERVITVSGRILREPANLLVRLGTKAQDILEFCGGLVEDPAKIIFGGPMMGVAQHTLEVPVIKGTSGIIVFDKEQATVQKAQACIRCARCLLVCPMGLAPSRLAQAIEHGRLDLAQELHVLDCVECGSCSFICPGSRNVVALVKLAKQQIKDLNVKANNA